MPRSHVIPLVLALALGLLAGLRLLGDAGIRGGRGVDGPSEETEPRVTRPPGLLASTSPGDPHTASRAATSEAESARVPAERIDARPEGATSIGLRVVDGEGRALEGLEVHWKRADRVPLPWLPVFDLGQHWERARGRTDAAGRLEVEGLERGTWVLAAGRRCERAFALSTPVELAVGRRSEVLITATTLAAERVVRGRVRLADGEPAPRARVQILWEDVFGKQRQRSVEATRQGVFAFAVAPDLRGALLVAYDAKMERAPAVEGGVDAGRRDLELRLGDPRTVEFVVRDELGAPLEQGRVSFSHEVGGHWRRVGFVDRDRGAGRTRRRFPAGRARWTVSAPGHRAVRSGVLEPEEFAELGPVLVIDLDALPAVTGRVVRGDVPVEGARVTLEPQPDTSEWPYRGPAGVITCGTGRLRIVEPDPTTGPDGGFSIPSPAAGLYRVEARHPEYGVAQPVVLTLGEGDVPSIELDLAIATATLRGRVILPDDVPASEVVLSPSSGPGVMALNEDGTYELPNLRPGPCEVVLMREMTFQWTPRGGLAQQERIGPPRTPRSGYFESKGFPLYGSIDPTRRWGDADFRVELSPGEVRELDLDVTRRPDCRLDVQLEFDDPRGLLEEYARLGNTARLLDLGSLESISASGANLEGRYSLEVREPGTYRLELDHVFRIADRVQVQFGDQRWKRTIGVGALTLLPPPGARAVPDVDGIRAEWRGPAGERAKPLRPRANQVTGGLEWRAVPSGRVVVTRAGVEAREVLVEATVETGETAIVRHP